VKLALVTRYPRDPEAPCGGVEAVSVALVRALARRADVDLHVVTTDDVTGAQDETEHGVRVHRLPRRGGRVLTEAIGPGRRQMRRYLTALAPDVIHSHDVCGLMVKGLPVPRVFTVHGFIHADTRVSGGRFALVRSYLWSWVERAGFRDQPHIISISPYVRERLSGTVPGTIHDIENPVAEPFFRIARRERPGTIFSAAAVEPRKNTLGLVEAFARVAAQRPEARLRLAGGVADAAYGRRVDERIAELGIGAQVTRLGPVSSDAIRAELSMAAVFALVSLEENAPMAIEEAMAAGVPVVTSNRCGMPFLVRDGASGFLVDPTDPGDVAARLEALLADDTRRAAMGACSRQIAEERFHPDAIAARTMDVYRCALAGRGPRPA